MTSSIIVALYHDVMTSSSIVFSLLVYSSQCPAPQHLTVLMKYVLSDLSDLRIITSLFSIIQLFLKNRLSFNGLFLFACFCWGFDGFTCYFGLFDLFLFFLKGFSSSLYYFFNCLNNSIPT